MTRGSFVRALYLFLLCKTPRAQIHGRDAIKKMKRMVEVFDTAGSFEFVEKYADGSIFLGSEAKEAGFIDELGNKQDVKEYLEKELGEDVKFKKYKTSKGLADLIGSVMTEQSLNIGRGLGDKLLQEDKTKVLV